MDLKEELEKLAIADPLRVKDDFNRFGVRSMISVGRIRHITARIADSCGQYAVVAAQQILDAPETAAGENRTFSRCSHVSLLTLSRAFRVRSRAIPALSPSRALPGIPRPPPPHTPPPSPPTH